VADAVMLSGGVSENVYGRQHLFRDLGAAIVASLSPVFRQPGRVDR
jgi:hypothetical protein